MFNLFIFRPTCVLKLKVMNNIHLKSGLRYLVGLIVEASESVKDCGQFHLFGTFLQYFFRVFIGHIAVFFKNLRQYYLNRFFVNLIFGFIL